MTEYISLIIAAAGFIASVFYSGRTLKQSIKSQEQRHEAEREKRQEDLLDKAEKDAVRHTQIIERLNTLVKNTDENKREISDLKDEVKRLNDTQIANVRDVKTAFNRIEKVESRLELLHKEHRERTGKCVYEKE